MKKRYAASWSRKGSSSLSGAENERKKPKPLTAVRAKQTLNPVFTSEKGKQKKCIICPMRPWIPKTEA